MSRLRTPLVALAAAAAIGLPLATATAAEARPTYASVEVWVSTYWSDEIVVCGHNQYNDYVCSHPNTRTPGKGFAKVSGWWWKKGSLIEITGHNKSDNTYPKAKFRLGYAQGSEYECAVYDKYATCDGRYGRRL
ncbi:hypothetical protein GCM10010218_01990 [Streptomyces mashuensis]|uniref:Secreted protein n=1 Tax=Streptomyces mashuensis TaxID=33904 RepID=A0A919AT62_9ACTN|nr:hypothetical protein [Streptomyces mashuensis]GHF24934.1 hypothetical protein GCM10010218_01990 [Streptomyces mashuensis]